MGKGKIKVRRDRGVCPVFKNCYMKKVFLLPVFYFLTVFGYGQVKKNAIAAKDTVTEAQVSTIRQVYNSINRERGAMRLVTGDLPDKSAEGGESRKYYAGSDLRKLVIKLYGEAGRYSGEYYFQGGKLCFYYALEERYNTSIAVPGNKVIAKKSDGFISMKIN